MKKIFLLFLSSLILAGCISVTNTTNSSSVSSSDSSSSVISQSSVLNFTVKDVDGNDVNLADYQGKKVYINFWATWCGPCIREIPELEEVYQKYRTRMTLFSYPLPRPMMQNLPIPIQLMKVRK